MKVHSVQKIKNIKTLRSQGLSIQQIMSALSLPKTTVWNHVQNVPLSDSQKATLRSQQGGSRNRKITNVKISEKLASSLLNGVFREEVIIISMLYWAEGHKNSGCEFTNTDGGMISLYLKILRDILNINDHSIKITVRIFDGMSKKSCLNYWSSVTNISVQKIKTRMNDGGKRGRTKYGICRVTILKGHATLKLMHALVENILKEYIGLEMPL